VALVGLHEETGLDQVFELFCAEVLVGSRIRPRWMARRRGAAANRRALRAMSSIYSTMAADS